ncbi:MAG: radical SAM protein [Anaerolineae bacterium]
MDDKVLVGKDGELRLPEEQRRRWGLTPGAELLIRETLEGLLLRPSDPPLAKVYVEPTTDCNLRCRICVRNSWSELVGSMQMATYRRLVDGLREVPSLRTMAFWGFGEPLLHPDIVEMVALAKELGAKTELITNGLLLDREMAEGLVMAGLDTLVVSVDGTSPESHADVRSGADLRLVQKNVEGLHAARRANRLDNPEIGLEFVATRRNVSELPNLHRLAYSMEASFIVVTNVLPYTEEFKGEILYWLATGSYPLARSKWSPEIVLPRMDARREYLEPLLRLLQQGGVIDPLPRRSDGTEGYCRFVGEGAVAVAWDGEVSPCVALMHSYTCYVLGREKVIRRYTLGNVGREEITRIWDRDEYVQFRARVQQFDFSPCAHCGGCQWAESNEEDCFGNEFPVCGDCLWARGIILCP